MTTPPARPPTQRTRRLTTPSVRGLGDAVRGVADALAAVDRHRVSGGNAEGGDPGHHASPALLVRHTVNYLLAADLADGVAVEGPVLDVGSGVGTFSAWLAGRLERRLHLADHDRTVLAVAERAYPAVTVHDTVSDAPPAAVVTAMEVVEHVPYRDQVAFVRALLSRLRPGGLAVLSTPDEGGYVGGWSGYAPHIGTLGFDGLRTLLRDTTSLPSAVWRIDGPGFRLRPAQRLLEPVANRAWTAVQGAAPTLTGRLVDAVGRRRRAGRDGAATSPPPAPDDAAFTVSADAGGPGTGLFAAVFRPPP